MSPLWSPPFTARLISGAASELPTTRQANLVLAPPINLGGGSQQFAMLIGPDAQLGSTSGVDTNDPTYVPGPPAALLTSDATDFVTFGDALGSVWLGAFSIIGFIEPDADDAAAVAIRGYFAKTNNIDKCTMQFAIYDKMFSLSLYHGGQFGDRTEYFCPLNTLVAGTRLIIGASYDPALSRANRCKLYINGAPVAVSPNLIGSDAAPVQNFADIELRVGMDDQNANPPVNKMRIPYAWNAGLNDGEFASATTEVDALVGGWLP